MSAQIAGVFDQRRYDVYVTSMVFFSKLLLELPEASVHEAHRSIIAHSFGVLDQPDLRSKTIGRRQISGLGLLPLLPSVPESAVAVDAALSAPPDRDHRHSAGPAVQQPSQQRLVLVPMSRLEGVPFHQPLRPIPRLPIDDGRVLAEDRSLVTDIPGIVNVGHEVAQGIGVAIRYLSAANTVAPAGHPL